MEGRASPGGTRACAKAQRWEGRSLVVQERPVQGKREEVWTCKRRLEGAGPDLCGFEDLLGLLDLIPSQWEATEAGLWVVESWGVVCLPFKKLALTCCVE